MSWVLALFTKWRAASRAGQLARIQQIIDKGFAAMD